jgi:Ca2+/Na+ antiporter
VNATPSLATAEEIEEGTLTKVFRILKNTVLFPRLIRPLASTKNGWALFFYSIVEIGLYIFLLQEVINDIVAITGVNKYYVGIFIVASLTSMPDALVSKNAAMKKKHADDAFTNIGMSNLFNTFFGFGMPAIFALVMIRGALQKGVQVSTEGKWESCFFLVALVVILMVFSVFRFKVSGQHTKKAMIGLCMGMYASFLIMVVAKEWILMFTEAFGKKFKP